MSKAFMRESDFEELPELPRASATLPPGVKNLMTAAGAGRLRAELRELVDVARPPVAARVTDSPETRGDLLMLDQRIRHLRLILESAEIIAPVAGGGDTVRFATARHHIVGVDETDAGADMISWQSPLARALLNARLGEQVTFQAPGGRRELVVVAIE
jgi:transcription elongation factor GreB